MDPTARRALWDLILRLKQGRVIQNDSPVHTGLFNLVSENGQFIGIGEATNDGRILPKRLMNTAR